MRWPLRLGSVCCSERAFSEPNARRRRRRGIRRATFPPERSAIEDACHCERAIAVSGICCDEATNLAEPALDNDDECESDDAVIALDKIRRRIGVVELRYNPFARGYSHRAHHMREMMKFDDRRRVGTARVDESPISASRRWIEGHVRYLKV